MQCNRSTFSSHKQSSESGKRLFIAFSVYVLLNKCYTIGKQVIFNPNARACCWEWMHLLVCTNTHEHTHIQWHFCVFIHLWDLIHILRLCRVFVYYIHAGLDVLFSLLLKFWYASLRWQTKSHRVCLSDRMHTSTYRVCLSNKNIK